MRKKEVAVIGAGGKMGAEIATALRESLLVKPSLGVVRNKSQAPFPEVVTSLNEKAFQKIDVIIDFSSVEAFSKNLRLAQKLNLPFVSGVTGISTEQKNELKKVAKKIPVLWSANMSLGIATLVNALSSLKSLKGFDFQVEELHHNKKKDSPSGTALYLQHELEQQTKKKAPPPVAIRGGGIFGVHKVYAMSDDEVLIFEHTALNRKLFAKGAVKAAEWIVHQKPGLYEMKDIFRS